MLNKVRRIYYFCIVIYIEFNTITMQKEGKTKQEQILFNFEIEGNPVEIVPLGNGLINDTYKVNMPEGAPHDYVLQRINHHIFTDVELLQHNIEVVTRHIRKKLEAAGEQDIDRKVLHFVQTKDGKTYHKTSEGEFWRVSVYIPRTQTYSQVTPQNAYDCGRTFGRFESMLSDVDEELGETIPDFHNMELRIRQLREAVKADAAGRLNEVQSLVDKIEEHAEAMCLGERLYREGKLPKHLCHCDTKVNNMLFDENGQVLCVIDLDTVMPSFVFSDYGDFLRTAANVVQEDDSDVSKVALHWDVIESFTKGYVEGTKSFLTERERDLLPYAMRLFPYMQCVRFLADYLNGDTYFKTTHATHNLERARNQWRLFELTLAGNDRLAQYIKTL